MAAINPQVIVGNWESGVALDVHTISSTHNGFDQFGNDVFVTVRSELGELLYRLKYRVDQTAVAEIVAAAAQFLKPHRAKFDLIVPVPPSTPRVVQPVIVLANGIGAALAAPVVQCITTTRPTTQLKEVTDPQERQKLLEGLHAVDPVHTQGKNILLFDDLFRSGATMRAITDVLLQQGKTASVRVLTITKTRSNQ